jgi:hypothetical protein
METLVITDASVLLNLLASGIVMIWQRRNAVAADRMRTIADSISRLARDRPGGLRPPDDRVRTSTKVWA